MGQFSLNADLPLLLTERAKLADVPLDLEARESDRERLRAIDKVLIRMRNAALSEWGILKLNPGLEERETRLQYLEKVMEKIDTSGVVTANSLYTVSRGAPLALQTEATQSLMHARPLHGEIANENDIACHLQTDYDLLTQEGGEISDVEILHNAPI